MVTLIRAEIVQRPLFGKMARPIPGEYEPVFMAISIVHFFGNRKMRQTESGLSAYVLC